MPTTTYNVNVGVLGHVDSGKTSLVAALSTTLSTAALDKNPQSRERGITLDLGFSSFTVAAPPHMQAAGYSLVQFTLVDCPGHASLIRTIIGGAQIIDLMVLVVDASKGIQTQTAECIVIGEVAAADMVVALNKIGMWRGVGGALMGDQFPAEKRERYCRKAQKLVGATLAATKFAGCPIVPVAARPGTPDSADASQGGQAAPLGVQQLVDTLLERVQLRAEGGGSSRGSGGQSGAAAAQQQQQQQQQQQPFLFYIDHCFAIKGQGTVLTGTVMRGGVRVGDTVELPELRAQKKVKSMQMFRQPVQACSRGDRLGICVTQLDAKQVERGLACMPGTVPTFTAAVARVQKIRFYGAEVRSRSKMHVTVGHTTVMAELQFFGLPDGEAETANDAQRQRLAQLTLGGQRQQPGGGDGVAASAFDSSRHYLYQDCLYGSEGRPLCWAAPAAAQHCAQQQGGSEPADAPAAAHQGQQWAYLRFSQPVTAPEESLVIGSKLDADLHTSSCRLAFHGRLCRLLDPSDQTELHRLLPVYKPKQREGVIERVEADGCTAVCRHASITVGNTYTFGAALGMFQKETDLALFAGMRVAAWDGQEGRIEGGFGKSGKFKVFFSGGAPQVQQGQPPPRILLQFKRFIFDGDKRRMVQ
ncbi:Selenocysteine-specific elongation factor [Chlorella vulgaris]